jgi:cytochrome c oxidase cbb3-type subunit 3
MRYLAIILTVSFGFITACGDRHPVEAPVTSPGKIADFNVLYTANCSGCHGVDGKGGAAIGIGDPVYLGISDDTTIGRVTADGVPGTSMPAFAQHSGGMLTDDQIAVIVRGIRSRWAKPDALHGAVAPPYAAQTPGDPKRGAGVYSAYCSACHGTDGHGSKQASSIVDASYLALVSDQGLRTTVIVGRPELGAPDWRGNIPGKPMSPEDVSDVVAWMAAQRREFPGQPYSTALRPEGGIR